MALATVGARGEAPQGVAPGLTPPSLAAAPEVTAAPEATAPPSGPADAHPNDVAVVAPPVLLAQNTIKHDVRPIGQPAVQQAAHEAKLSDAERIANLSRSIEADAKTLGQIDAALENPESEYYKAEREFNKLDADVKTAEKRHQQLAADEQVTEGAAAKQDLEKLQNQWKLAKERFQLAIEERKTVQEKAATLKRKLKQDQEALAKLTGTDTAAGGNGESGGDEQATPAGAVTAPTADATDAAAAPSGAAPASAAKPSPLSVAMPGLALPSAESKPAASAPAAERSKPANKEIAKAAEVAEQKEAAALVAEQEAESLGERLELLRKGTELERKLLANARKKGDIAFQTHVTLNEEYSKKIREGAGSDVLLDLHNRTSEADRRFREAHAEVRQRSMHLDELQSRYAALQAEQIIAMNQAEQMRKEAESARLKVEQLRNPFTIQNMLQWLIDNGPRVFAILLIMAIGLWFSRMAERRIVLAIVRRGGITKRAERENRARTLVGVIQNATNVAILSSGTLMVLDAIGAPITALMGGAAVFGLAIAFGAQSLIKDYFYGFMILLEQQYTVNDVIKIGDIAGQVERISLRMTVLRDLEGRVHFVPHGQITSATNMTHGWSRAVFELGIAYKEDADRVMALIHELGAELREDETFGPLILEDLTMLGVDSFSESAVVLKFYFKTRPLKQWDVRREMLRRIKRRFDDCGVEIPFPHRTIYHRYTDPDAILGHENSFAAEMPKRKSA